MTELQGYVDHIIYRNASNGYTVLVLQTEKDELTLTGSFKSIEDGEYISVTGEMSFHPSYGEQFKVQNYEIKEPEDIVSIERYLSSGTIKGVGVALAKRIVKKFGEDTFRIMEEEPERLTEIKGISERIAISIAEQMQEKRGMRRAMIFLQDLGMTTNLAVKIFAAYDMKLFDILKTNPYKMVEDIQGVGFKTADELAQKLGISMASEFRIKSGILYVLSQAMADGHVYLPENILLDKSCELLLVEREDIAEFIETLIMEGKLIQRAENDEIKIFSAACYYMELDCARMLKDIDIRSFESEDILRAAIADIERAGSIELDKAQKDAVIMAAGNGLSIITGGPGTGKTTIIKALLGYFDKNNEDVLLAAPTGRAAKRMTEATGYEASTIHRLLEFGMEGAMEFARNEQNPLEADVVIIDEMSMVDIYLFHALLKAVCPGMKLILVGDASQLPSVGPGLVLKDIIASKRFNVATLDKIFRQSEKSDIVVNAHRINRGENISLDNKSEDFFFLERDNIDVIIEGIVYLVTKKLPPYVNASPLDIQVMTPMRKGALGVVNLNKMLQERLNPPQKGREEYTYGDLLLREGDKVMQIKNNYQIEWEITSKYGMCLERGMGVFNGDMGTVAEINKLSGVVKVIFDDRRCVLYNTAQLEELELAYAITIHKSQGSEYPAVVIPLLSGPTMLMNRNLLYTAVTRAKKCVMLIGSSQTVRDMINNKNEQRRYTDLRERINEIFEISLPE